MMVTPVELLGGVALDFAVGDPRWLPHPVVGIGILAAATEKVLRSSELPLVVAGCLAWLAVVLLSGSLVYASIVLLPAPWIQVYWIFSLLAVRSLDEHAMAVISCLKAGDVSAARHAVSMIVGRDTAGLDQQEITRAVFETVAESLNDGVIAPLFWLGVAGPVGMVVYKAVNTMDSMFGYKSERYLQFGWAAARMDDLANLIPARLTAGLIWIIAAVTSGLSARNSFRITLRDANTQPSPNSGYPEAAVAGALGVQFGGVNFYRGVRSEKHFLGDMLRPLEANHYGLLRVILYGSATLFALLLGGIAQWA